VVTRRTPACRKNARIVAKHDGRPLLMPKRRMLPPSRARQLFSLEGDDDELQERSSTRAFRNRYHKRSNFESANSSIQGECGERLYSRTWHIQKRKA
jgi:hypothetical protein